MPTEMVGIAIYMGFKRRFRGVFIYFINQYIRVSIMGIKYV